MTIFNNYLKFIIGEENIFREIISPGRKVSMDYNLPGREMVWGKLIDKCFENHINNKHEKLINGSYIYGLHFQGEWTTIKDTPLINILAEGVHLPVSLQNIMDCTGHITGGNKKDSKFVADSFFDSMNDLDTDKKLVDLHMLYGSSVYRKAKKIEVFIYYAVIYFWRRSYMP